MKLLAFVFIGLGLTGENLAGQNNTTDLNTLEECFVWVENARVRKTADLKSEIITELKGGEKVVLTGEKSTDKIKVTLRGVVFEDVWVKVKTTDNKEGWMFKGMLTPDENRARAMNDFLIVPGERVGRVNFKSTKKEIIEIFGEEFITAGGGYYFESNEVMPGVTLFKDSPFELQCPFNEDSTILLIRIVKPNNFWQTKDSIRVGSTLEQMVKLNGKPLEFSGMGWDFGGQITNYNKGELEKLNLRMTFYCDQCPDELYGDKVTLNTLNKNILHKGIKVGSLETWQSK